MKKHRLRISIVTVVTLVIMIVSAPPARASEPFLGQIIMFGGNFAPRSWALCDGQLLPIAQNSALFSILGTIYGGDGRTTFALPDMRGRVPIHPGNGPGLSSYNLGQKGGSEQATLSVNQLPNHGHVTVLKATSTDGNQEGPGGHILAGDPREDQYSDATPNVNMNPAGIEVANTGNNEAHANVQPFVCVNFIIALQGLFPSRN